MKFMLDRIYVFVCFYPGVERGSDLHFLKLILRFLAHETRPESNFQEYKFDDSDEDPENLTPEDKT